MYRRVLALSLLALGILFSPASASAAPFRLTFEGAWGFYDPYQDQPDFWDALNGAGVFTGTPLTYSVLVSEFDTHENPFGASYRVLTSSLSVGSVRQTTEPATLYVGTSGVMTSTAWLGAPVGPYAPSFMQLSSDGAVLPSDQLADLYPYLNSGRTLLYIGYNSGTCHLCLGVSQVTLTSVEPVPEPSSVLLLTIGALLLLPQVRRRLREPALRAPHSPS